MLGSLFYFFFRSADHTYILKFLDPNPYRNEYLPPVIVTLGNSLPTYIHVLAFSLMTSGLVATQKRGYALVCLAWFVIDVLFEFGQESGDRIIPIIPSWFSTFLFLENTGDYFLHGRFDYLDLLSIALGSVTAYVFLVLTRKENGDQHEKQIL
jgi:hypothetical protein